MQLSLFHLVLLSSSIFAPLTLCISPISLNPALQAGGDPLHVPVCTEPGGYDLYICARLITAMKRLPYYNSRMVWSEYATGDGKLPATFHYDDPAGRRGCHLSLYLYEPGTPRTAYERFSLDEVQTDFNNVYFECLRAKGLGGHVRLGFVGNVAALLGPFPDHNSLTLPGSGAPTANPNLHTVNLTSMADS
ncbi:MAG: hypothetical protein Q9222_001572 [Ikaeria aurantiellina]